MNALKAWQTFHQHVENIEASTLHKIVPYLGLGSDWASSFPPSLVIRALATKGRTQALIYKAMELKYDEDITQGARYVF